MKWTWTVGNCQVRATLPSRSGGFLWGWKEETSAPWDHIKDQGSLFLSPHWHITMPIVPQWKQYMHHSLCHTSRTKSKLSYVILLAHSYTNDELVWTVWAKINWSNHWMRVTTQFLIVLAKFWRCVCHPQLTYSDVSWSATLGLLLKQFNLASRIKTETCQDTSAHV